MLHVSGSQSVSVSTSGRRAVSALLGVALITAWAVSVFTVVEELCLATACRDTAAFTFFGIGMGWFGIAFFSFILLLLRMRNKYPLLNWMLAGMVFSGAGAELRLLWIQKYIIGSWCPLCVTICIALFFAAGALAVEAVLDARSDTERRRRLLLLTLYALTMIVIGLAVAVMGVQALQ